jgi:hypothetical protein
VTPGARGQVLKILTNIANTDQYCYRAVVAKDVFVHKEETEVAGGFQAMMLTEYTGHYC